jgi:hypothetical protein
MRLTLGNPIECDRWDESFPEGESERATRDAARKFRRHRLLLNSTTFKVERSH